MVEKKLTVVENVKYCFGNQYIILRWAMIHGHT